MTRNIPLVITPAILQDRSLNSSLFLSEAKAHKTCNRCVKRYIIYLIIYSEYVPTSLNTLV